VTKLDLLINSRELLSPKKILVWTTTKGNAQIDFILMGYLYRSLELLGIDGEYHRSYLRRGRATGMHNRHVFNKFFSLKEATWVSRSIIDNKKFEKSFEAISTRLELIPSAVQAYNQFVDSSADCWEEEAEELDDIEEFLRRIEKCGAREEGEGDYVFEFSQFEMFLATVSIVYKQQESVIVEFNRSDDSKYMEYLTFEHLVSLFGSKIIVTEFLPEVFSRLFDTQKGKGKKDASVNHRKTEVEMAESGKKELITDNDKSYMSMKVRSHTNYLYGIVINKPQFNFHDYLNQNQTIFMSKKQCVLQIIEQVLPFDALKIDPKYTTSAIFKDLELYNSRLQ
jgi:hypothetical protein